MIYRHHQRKILTLVDGANHVPNRKRVASEVATGQQKSCGWDPVKKFSVARWVHPRHRDDHQPSELGAQVHFGDRFIDALL